MAEFIETLLGTIGFAWIIAVLFIGNLGGRI